VASFRLSFTAGVSGRYSIVFLAGDDSTLRTESEDIEGAITASTETAGFVHLINPVASVELLDGYDQNVVLKQDWDPPPKVRVFGVNGNSVRLTSVHISAVVYHADGVTLAKDVVLELPAVRWQVDESGVVTLTDLVFIRGQTGKYKVEFRVAGLNVTLTDKLSVRDPDEVDTSNLSRLFVTVLLVALLSVPLFMVTKIKVNKVIAAGGIVAGLGTSGSSIYALVVVLLEDRYNPFEVGSCFASAFCGALTALPMVCCTSLSSAPVP
jgi:hypothetical protein